MRKIAILALLAGAWPGCVSNYSTPQAPPAVQTEAQKNFDAVWNASLAVLRDYRFTVAVEDRRAGTITTAALVGKQAGEFWRKDAISPQDVAESTFQTIYKTATVTIRQAPDRPDTYVAGVTVDVSRSDRPAFTVTSTSDAYGLFPITGERSRWLTDFGRAEDEAAEEKAEAKSPSEALRPTEGQPKTKKALPAARWMVPLGTDDSLGRQMTSEIAWTLLKRPGGRQ